MDFVLDASLTMSWLLGDAKIADRAYAATVLDALRRVRRRMASSRKRRAMLF